MFKKIFAYLIVVSMVFTNIGTVFAEIADPSPALSPLQERINRDTNNNIEETENEVIEETLTSDEQGLIDEINNNPITVSESENNLETAISSEQETLSEESQMVAVNEAPLEIQEEALATLSSAASGIPDSFKVEPVNSVYNIINNNNDYVSQATGALTYEKSLLSLPGANGLDLNLSVRYNSDDAVISVNEFADTNETVRKINFNSFAIGWSFGFPTVVKSNVKKNYGFEKQTNLRFPDGSAYKILHDNDDLTSDITLTLEFYKLSDMTLIRKADTKDYVLTYSDGRTETFDGTYGNIKQIKDSFGNCINFEYTELDYFRGSFIDYMFKPSSYSATINALTKITDSAGRIITIEYTMSSTAYGKEVNGIRVKMNGTTYSTIELSHVKSYCGNVDIVNQITDGEGNHTFYQYDEKFSHIFGSGLNGDTDSYTLSGSVFALEKVILPTGGYINYEYEKARRNYSWYTPQVVIDDWYEVYKISRVSDSSGFLRTYEYENDRSGYPYGRLSIQIPNVQGGYVTLYSGVTGYISPSTVNYYCVMRQNGATTITTFDYMHNKTREETYSENDFINSYIVGKGTSTYQVIIGNYIYHIGNTAYGYNSTKSYLYKQNVSTGEVVILKPYSTAIPTNAQIKSYNGQIYMFYKIGSGTTDYPYKLIAKVYNLTTETWVEAGEYQMDSTIGANVRLDNMYYTNSKFYGWNYKNNSYGTDYLYHAVYNPAAAINSRWSVNQSDMSISSYGIDYICQNGNKVYYNDRQTIYEYDLSSNTMTNKSFSALDRYGMNGGFSIGTRTFIFDYDLIREFNFATGTTGDAITYSGSKTFKGLYIPSSNYTTYNYCTIQKGTDGNIYYISNSTFPNGLRPIYRFNPDDSEDKFSLVSNRLINNNISSILAAADCLYLVSDGVEKVNLNLQSQTATAVRNNYEYNSLNQLVSSTITRINGSDSQNGGTESQTYIDGKNILNGKIDILGNKTVYEYTNSPYYISTKVTQYADTENAIETINTLSEDKKKIVETQVSYSDKILKKAYTYADAEKPGNVTSELLYESPPDTVNFSLVMQTDYGYDSSKTIVERVTNKNVVTNDGDFTLAPMQDYMVSSTHNALGLVTSETDASGRTTHYGYNKNGWKTWTVNSDDTTVDIYYDLSGANGGENTISTVYNESYTVTDYFDDLGRQILESEKQIGGVETVLSSYEYDGHRVSKATDGNENYSLYDYDSFDRVTSLSQYNLDNTMCGSYAVSFDDFNLARTINNSGKTGTTFYDIAGRIIRDETQTAAGLAISKTEYDYMGNVCKTIRPENEQTIYSYNKRGLLISAKNALNQETSYTYNALGKPLTVTTCGELIQTNTYDNLGRQLSSTDAMGFTEKYAYDSIGRVIKSQDKNGENTSYTYKVNTDYIEKQTTGKMELDFTYDSFGNVLTKTNYTGTYSYSYQYNNLLAGITAPDGKNISYTYDNNHNVKSVKDYSGDNIIYSYNGLNSITNIQRNGNSVASYEYYSYGTLKSANYPNQGKSEYSYDNALRLTEQTNTLSNSTAVNAYSYVYDLNGNQISKTDNNQTTSYTYDSIGRLSNVSEPDGTQTAYTFDNRNNIMTKSITHPASYEFSFKQDGQDFILSNVSSDMFTYAYDKNNRLKFEGQYIDGANETYRGSLEITNYSEYDNNGNILKTTTGGQTDESMVHYTYTPLNQLSQYTDKDGKDTSYYYNPDGMRYSMFDDNDVETKYYWDRGYMADESINGNITAQNFIGVGGVFARQASSGTSYMMKNGHGDVTSLVSGGAVTQNYDYDAYGKEKNADETDTNPFRYCGEYTDLSSGMLYLRNRYYNSSNGRFIVEDTHWNVGNMIYGDKEYKSDELKIPDYFAIEQSSNLYGFCGNNPIGRIDPSGQNWLYNAWNWGEDGIWKGIAIGVSAYGWQLSADLLWLAASGAGNTYTATSGSYASNLAKNDYGLIQAVNGIIWEYGTNTGKTYISTPVVSYEIPLGNGDLGAALHWVGIQVNAWQQSNGAWYANVTITDKFDFTELKNPLKQGSILKGFLWAANDIAYIDSEWNLLDSVQVSISFNDYY